VDGLERRRLEPYAAYSATIPHQAFMIFQGMFAVITPALIIGLSRTHEVQRIFNIHYRLVFHSI